MSDKKRELIVYIGILTILVLLCVLAMLLCLKMIYSLAPFNTVPIEDVIAKPVSSETPIPEPIENAIVFEKVIEVREEAAEYTEIHPWAISVSEEELEILSRVVMSEASTVPYIGKVAVASVIVNRVIDGRWGDNVHDVVYYEDAFSTADNGEVTDECRAAVLQALECGQAFPKDMFYFRDDHYHKKIGYPYVQIGNLYFSTEIDYNELIAEASYEEQEE